jgi:sugar lactone lactonase YvrE
MTTYQPKRVLTIKAELGEHPVWSVEDQRLYWLDIDGGTINRFDPVSGENTAWSLPTRPGCFAFREGGGAVIAAGDGIYDFDFATGTARRIMASGHDPAQLRFNDGKTDRQGRLWSGTVRADHNLFETGQNAYWRYDGRTLDRMLTDVGVSNGTAFSPDGRTMYRGQTEARTVFAYDYDPQSGTPSNPRVFATIPDGLGMPDGAAVDTEGGYWCAIAQPVVGAKPGVVRFTPDGRMDLFFDMPIPITTMVAFGGPQMSTLYITTGRMEAMMPYETPEVAGSLYAVETPFRGIPEPYFRAQG